jgi:hypothetical protein
MLASPASQLGHLPFQVQVAADHLATDTEDIHLECSPPTYRRTALGCPDGCSYSIQALGEISLACVFPFYAHAWTEGKIVNMLLVYDSSLA